MKRMTRPRVARTRVASTAFAVARAVPRAVAFALALGLAALGAGLAGCSSPFAAAWRTTEAVRQAGSATDRAFGEAAQRKHAECVAAHGPQTEGYARCIDKHRRALKAWRTVARPAVNSALAATVASIQLAERAKATDHKPSDWEPYLAPAICAVARAMSEWGDLLGKDKDQVLALLGAMKGVSCHD